MRCLFKLSETVTRLPAGLTARALGAVLLTMTALPEPVEAQQVQTFKPERKTLPDGADV